MGDPLPLIWRVIVWVLMWTKQGNLIVEGKVEGVEKVGPAFLNDKPDPEGTVVSLRAVRLSSRTEVDSPGAAPAQISGNQIFGDFRRRDPY
jgi:hypothetical protein